MRDKYNVQPRHVRVNQAYADLVAKLLELKACGYSTDELADALVRAAREAGIERIA